jgi:hypothetical protein
MTMPEAQSTTLITALEQLGPHDCSIYENQEEQFSVAMPFISSTLLCNLLLRNMDCESFSKFQLNATFCVRQ